MSRVLRLTLLALDIVEAILNERQTAGLELDDLLEGFSLGWERQSRILAVNDRVIRTDLVAMMRHVR
jgi:hypothetical protein